MHIACMHGHTKIIDYLQENYPPSSNIDKYGCTPAFYSARMGYLDILKSVIKNSPHFDKMHTDNNTFTLIHYTAMYGQLKIMVYLIQELSFDPNTPTESGDTPLHIACRYGHIHIGKYLVNNLKRKMLPTNDGTYPIHSAAGNGQLQIFKWLILDVKLDPLSQCINGTTPFHYAAAYMHFDILQFGLESLRIDASVTDTKNNNLLHAVIFAMEENMTRPQNKQIKIINLLLKHDCSPVFKNNSQVSPLHGASRSGFVGVVELFMMKLQKQDIDLAVRDNFGLTPLHYACVNGHLDVVNVLVPDSSTLWIDVPLDKDEESPLHIAAKNGNLKLVMLLVEKKKHIPFCFNKRNVTPLHLAIAKGHHDIVKYFLSTFNPNLKPMFDDPSEKNFLQLALRSNNDEMVKYLLEKYKTLLNPDTVLFSAMKGKSVQVIDFIVSLWKKHYKKKMSPSNAIKILFMAISKGKIKVVVILIEKLGLDPKLKDEYGLNALHFACQFGKANIAMYLLSTQKYNVHAKTIDQSTALHFASKTGLFEVVKALLQKNCKILHCQKQGNNSIHYASLFGQLSLVSLYTKEYKCNPDIPGEEHWTPLHFAANYGHLSVVEHLVSTFNINLNARESYDGASALHLACRFGNLDIVKYLTGVYETRKIPYPLDKDEETALHYAARAGHLSIVKYLTKERHFDPMRKKDDGNMPLHLAATKGHSDIIAFFVWELGCNPNIKNLFYERYFFMGDVATWNVSKI